MAFTEPITVKEAIDNIDSRKFRLPAIQREFVWNQEQIENLFDSLMKKYPISSFLFWEVEGSNIQGYQFYDFIRDYHERDNFHNEKANVSGLNSIIAILDGQQRLTALYIGLRGSYAAKLQWKRWNNNDAFPKKRLYLNLLQYSSEDEKNYEFRFLTDTEASKSDDTHFWFRVGDILNIKGTYELNNYLIRHNLMTRPAKQSIFANETLFRLYEAINIDRPIIFFLEKGDSSLDKVLNIFIRVNSGGTKLSYSDLLLSIASAQWTNKDAREEIISFVDEINSIGGGFAIDKDFVLKTCLVLCDFPNIAFRVDNFKHETMMEIEKRWDSIKESIQSAFRLAYSFGFDRSTLASNGVMIPVAYYLSKIGNPPNFDISSHYNEDRKVIRKYIVISLLKRNFSGQPDNVIRILREVIKNSHANVFPLDEIITRTKGTNKNYTFDDDEIENLFDYQYGQPYTFSILAILYPGLNTRNTFHIDHIYPKSLFSVSKLRKEGIAEEKIEFYLDNYNRLANLQLLEGIPNKEKSDSMFDDWLNITYPAGSPEREAYIHTNYIPAGIDYNFSNFEEFINHRKKLIADAFRALIG